MVPVTQVVGLALALGALLGTGLCLVAAAAPRVGQVGLAARIAPYLLDVSEEARRLARRREVRVGEANKRSTDPSGRPPAPMIAQRAGPSGRRASVSYPRSLAFCAANSSSVRTPEAWSSPSCFNCSMGSGAGAAAAGAGAYCCWA